MHGLVGSWRPTLERHRTLPEQLGGLTRRKEMVPLHAECKLVPKARDQMKSKGAGIIAGLFESPLDTSQLNQDYSYTVQGVQN